MSNLPATSKITAIANFMADFLVNTLIHKLMGNCTFLIFSTTQIRIEYYFRGDRLRVSWSDQEEWTIAIDSWSTNKMRTLILNQLSPHETTMGDVEWPPPQQHKTQHFLSSFFFPHSSCLPCSTVKDMVRDDDRHTSPKIFVEFI